MDTTTPANPRRLPSLRVLITLIVVAPMALVAFALVSIAVITTRSISEQFGQEIVSGNTQRVTTDVENYLGSAIRVSDLYVRRIADGSLSPTNLSAWEKVMFQDLAANPDVASICFSTPAGDCTWLLHAHNRLELGMVSGDAKDRAIEFPATPDGKVDRDHPLRVYRYDAPDRGWFKTAMENDQPLWTPIYFWFSPNKGSASDTGTGYTRKVLDKDGNVIGVLIIDVTLSRISDHLKKLVSSGSVFIVDQDGKLVAASEGAVNSAEGQRMAPAESDSPAARAIAPLVTPDLIGERGTAPKETTERVMIGDEPARARVTEIRPYQTIHWHVVNVLPEGSFLATASSLRLRALLMACVAVAGGIALGLLLSRRLARPLLSLTQHVERVGAGDFETRLHLSLSSEMAELSTEVNKMAVALKHRMMLEHSLSVATEVQQSLLPHATPTIPGANVIASSQYCDSTGGDYYDFIDVTTPSGKRTIVAVGDVTGHGIGAALLMATARGAVRASAPDAPTLGHILTDVNDVLAGSSMGGMFMTLSLLSVEPETNFIRWANAGHDPAIIYYPESDSFEDLRSGDIPLGIEPDVIYRESTRPLMESGAIIVCGTDGIWEARNVSGEMFGKDRLRAVIRTNAASSASDINEALKRAMRDFLGTASLRDDVTYVILKLVEEKAPVPADPPIALSQTAQ